MNEEKLVNIICKEINDNLIGWDNAKKIKDKREFATEVLAIFPILNEYCNAGGFLVELRNDDWHSSDYSKITQIDNPLLDEFWTWKEVDDRKLRESENKAMWRASYYAYKKEQAQKENENA